MFNFTIIRGEIDKGAVYYTVTFEDGFTIDYRVNWRNGYSVMYTDNFLDLLIKSEKVKVF